MLKIGVCLLFLFASPLLAQEASPLVTTAPSAVGVFDQLQAKNRSRLFQNLPDPRGNHYVYIDDANLASGQGLSPEIQLQNDSRGVKVVVHALTSNQVSLAADEASVGTVRLRETASAPRPIEVKTTIDLQQPLHVRVRERIRK